MLATALIALVALLAAWQYRWICDDAMINFRIVENFVHGHGPVFNVGERTEVYSDPLWVAALVVLRVVAWFIPLGWSAALLGMLCTVLGMYFAGRAIALQRDDEEMTRWPVGLAVFASVPVVWEFMTSGLEIGMSIAWIGWSYCVVVRRSQTIGSPRVTAMVLGAGLLIRPDLLLISLCFLVAWWGSDEVFRTHNRPVRLVASRLAWAFVGPALYELFRMAYFASLVPNTGLVKSATSLWPSQGLAYLSNFLNPYWLWLPIVFLLAVQATRAISRRHDRRHSLLVMAPVVAGATSMLYFVAIGGDFMHGRLFLPGFFCLVMNAAVAFNNRWRIAAGIVLAGWSVTCVSALRWTLPPLTLYTTIGDERTVTLGLTHAAHPIVSADFAQSQWFGYGQQLYDGAVAYSPRHDGLVLGSNPKLFVALPPELPPIVGGRSGLGNVLIAATRPIGQVGYAAGSQVYIFDQLSLANPVSSHFSVHQRTKPGHEKVASMAWYIGRFGTPGDARQLNRYRRFSDFAPVTLAEVVAAREALACGQLRSYLRGITAPVTPRLLVSNFVNAFSNTTMTFDGNPLVAVRELCHHR